MYSFDEKLADAVADAILGEEAFENIRNVRIAVLYCDKEKKQNGRAVFADVKKLSELHSFLAGFDFVMTFYADTEYLSEEAMQVLIRHELMHVGVETRGGVTKLRVVPHDVQDFRGIIDLFGVDWPLMGGRK